MKKIIVFTNYSSLNSVSATLRTMKNIPLIKDNNFIVLNAPTLLFKKSTSINDGQIFLAKDEIQLNELASFIGNYDKKNIGVLKHSMPDEKSKIKFSEFKICESKGQHETRGKFYPDVLKIITNDDDQQKFSSLQKVIFGMDNKEAAKKDLVDGIVYDKIISKVIDEEISEFQFAVDNFISEVETLPNEERMNFESYNFKKAYDKFLINLQYE